MGAKPIMGKCSFFANFPLAVISEGTHQSENQAQRTQDAAGDSNDGTR